MQREKYLLIVSMMMFSFFILISCSSGGDDAAPPSPPLMDNTVDLPRTGQTTSYSNRDDGELCMGIDWPSPRFIDNGDETITDNLTGLMWTKDGNPPEIYGCVGHFQDWQEALAYVACLNTNNYSGYNDWRLPNINEMLSLVHAGEDVPAAWLTTQGFTNVREDRYWSSTTDAGDVDQAWHAYLSDGENAYSDTKTSANHTWPVRDGQGGEVELPQTGQTTSYESSDDGDGQKGAAWPDTRFVDNSDGTVTAQLTGLIWLKSPGCLTACNWSDALAAAGTLQDGVCDLTDGSAAGDWRLPNRNELRSLVHYGRQDQAAWLIGEGFTNVQAGGYWSSTTDAYSTGNAWSVDMNGGSVDTVLKTAGHYVWPVRGGVEP